MIDNIDSLTAELIIELSVKKYVLHFGVVQRKYTKCLYNETPQ